MWHNGHYEKLFWHFVTISHKVAVPRDPSEEKIIFGEHVVIFYEIVWVRGIKLLSPSYSILPYCT